MSKDLTEKLNGSQDEKLDRLVAAVERIETDLRDVKTRLDSLETKVDKRLKDTQPMWEAVQTQLGQLRSEFKSDLAGLRSEMEKGFRRLKHTYELHADSLADLHADWRDHEERLDKLEKVES